MPEHVTIQIARNVRVGGRAYSPGRIVEVSRDDAFILLRSGDAVPAPTPTVVETRTTGKAARKRPAKKSPADADASRGD